jgi:ELWxxDGT repeat protein
VLLRPGAAGATPSGIGAAPSFLRNVNGVLFFATYREQAGGWQLWKSDGSPFGTTMLKDALGLDVELVALDDRLVFSTRGGLWTSDGTPGGTVLVKALPFYPNGIKSVRGGVYFSDGRGELWKSDLTEAGTTLVRDIPPGFVFHDLTPAAITNAGDTVFFRAVDAAIGTELWKSDGTLDGTVPVADLNPVGG